MIRAGYISVYVIAFTLAIMSSSSLGVVEGRRQNRLDDLEEVQKGAIEYAVGFCRNFWQGFQQQVYKSNQAKLDPRCFDVESEDEIAQVYWAFYTLNPSDFLDAIIAMFNLFYDDYVDCQYEEAALVFVKHCNLYPEKCAPQEIQENLLDNVFTIIEIATSVAGVFHSNGYEVQSPEDMDDIMLQIGKDSAKLIEVVIGMRIHSWGTGKRRKAFTGGD